MAAVSDQNVAGLAPHQLLGAISDGLRSALIIEYNKILRNFRERRWEPAELNGGRLCEIVYTILRGYVDGKFPDGPSKPSNMYVACKALEQADSNSFPRSVRIQIPRLLIALYEIRNNRNVGHVGGDVDPNHQDATIVLAMSQWIMAELVRVFHKVDLDAAAAAVDALVERLIPVIWKTNGRIRVLDPRLGAKDSALVVLYATPRGMSSKQLAESIEYQNLSRFRKKVLPQLHSERLLDFDRSTDHVLLSPRGRHYVENELDLEIQE